MNDRPGYGGAQLLLYVSVCGWSLSQHCHPWIRHLEDYRYREYEYSTILLYTYVVTYTHWHWHWHYHCHIHCSCTVTYSYVYKLDPKVGDALVGIGYERSHLGQKGDTQHSFVNICRFIFCLIITTTGALSTKMTYFLCLSFFECCLSPSLVATNTKSTRRY